MSPSSVLRVQVRIAGFKAGTGRDEGGALRPAPGKWASESEESLGERFLTLQIRLLPLWP